jgi:hypothetical protein
MRRHFLRVGALIVGFCKLAASNILHVVVCDFCRQRNARVMPIGDTRLGAGFRGFGIATNFAE